MADRRVTAEHCGYPRNWGNTKYFANYDERFRNSTTDLVALPTHFDFRTSVLIGGKEGWKLVFFNH